MRDIPGCCRRIWGAAKPSASAAARRAGPGLRRESARRPATRPRRHGLRGRVVRSDQTDHAGARSSRRPAHTGTSIDVRGGEARRQSLADRQTPPAAVAGTTTRPWQWRWQPGGIIRREGVSSGVSTIPGTIPNRLSPCAETLLFGFFKAPVTILAVSHGLRPGTPIEPVRVADASLFLMLGSAAW